MILSYLQQFSDTEVRLCRLVPLFRALSNQKWQNVIFVRFPAPSSLKVRKATTSGMTMQMYIYR